VFVRPLAAHVNDFIAGTVVEFDDRLIDICWTIKISSHMAHAIEASFSLIPFHCSSTDERLQMVQMGSVLRLG
jgi:hypothetical protein